MLHINVPLQRHDDAWRDKPGGPFIAGCCRDCGICHQRFLVKELTAIAKLLTSGHQIVKASESKVPPTATSLNTSQAGESLTEVPWRLQGLPKQALQDFDDDEDTDDEELEACCCWIYNFHSILASVHQPNLDYADLGSSVICIHLHTSAYIWANRRRIFHLGVRAYLSIGCIWSDFLTFPSLHFHQLDPTSRG